MRTARSLVYSPRRSYRRSACAPARRNNERTTSRRLLRWVGTSVLASAVFQSRRAIYHPISLLLFRQRRETAARHVWRKCASPGVPLRRQADARAWSGRSTSFLAGLSRQPRNGSAAGHLPPVRRQLNSTTTSTWSKQTRRLVDEYNQEAADRSPRIRSWQALALVGRRIAGRKSGNNR